MLKDLPAERSDSPVAAEPELFAPYADFLNKELRMRWSVVQRAFMVHGVDSFQAYVAAANKYDASFAARMIGDILYIERPSALPQCSARTAAEPVCDA
jgi:hypothetical protein